VLKLNQVPNNADESLIRPNPLPRCNGLPINRSTHCKNAAEDYKKFICMIKSKLSTLLGISEILHARQ
jgi:hypothetical protein